MKTLTIKSIELINFMCHRNLKISFEKMITCIGGRNGSGKSAIMIALGVLFGQRTQALERGNSCKNLIKTGCNQAIIKVVINNYKKYKFEKFGNFITIEKVLRESKSKLSIYNSYGKIFNLIKSELEGIVDFYDLKFENPLNFLTQEKSKKFLNVTKPESLYEFYYIGTEFKDIQDELDQSNIILKELEAKIADLNDKQTDLESKLYFEKENLKILQFDPDATLKKIENEEEWLAYQGDLKELEKITNTIEEFDKEILSKEQKRNDLISKETNLLTEICTRDIDEELNKINLQKHSIESELQEFSQEKTNILEKINIIKSMDKRDAINSEIENLSFMLSDKKQILLDLESKREDYQMNQQKELKENEEKKNKIFNLKKQIEYLKNNNVDQNKQIHFENIKKIKYELNKHTFKDQVIGPVFEHVKLKESGWYKPVSIILNKSLTNYILFNSEDKKRLLSIFNKLNLNYSVTQVLNKERYKNLKKNPKYKTVLDVLDIDNTVVSNSLITIHSIEQIVLFENRDKAHQIIRSKPNDVDCAYIPIGDKIKMLNGSLSDFRQKDDGFYWFEDRSTKIFKYEHEISKIKIIEEQKNRFDNLMNQLGVISNQIEAGEKRLKYLEFELDAISKHKENDIEPYEKKLFILEKNLNSLLNRKTVLETKYNEVFRNKNQINEDNQKRKLEMARLKDFKEAELQKVDYDIMVLQNRKASKIGERRLVEQSIDNKVKNLGERPETIREQTEINKERHFIIECKKKAQEMLPRETVIKNIEKLEKELSFYTDVKTKFEKSILETSEACKRRMAKKEEIKGKNTEEAIQMFREYTRRSGYEGIMSIDHNNKRLDLKMKVHNSEIAGSKSTLSGGERSFAGVCFLLSMWKCFKCPVKVLDEFDVFMDTLNRKTAIKSLFEFFKDNHVQVILITPLDTNDLVDPECEIKVIKKEEVNG